MLYDEIEKISGKDTLMVFGVSGTCKTTFATELLKAAKTKGLQGLYIDTEKNIIDEKSLGCDYMYCSSFDMLYSAVMNLKRGYNVIVLDSIGLPVLGEYATKDLRQRGEILLKAEAISYMLKKYSQTNNSIILVCNQPVSEFGKINKSDLPPFGDKSKYFYKEIWRTQMISSTPTETRCVITAYRSRRMGMGAKIFTICTSSAGVKVERC